MDLVARFLNEHWGMLRQASFANIYIVCFYFKLFAALLFNIARVQIKLNEVDKNPPRHFILYGWVEKNADKQGLTKMERCLLYSPAST
mmetsp:Transcript_11616/g.16893  ORF Transcript_11616/g.16893 Transcript_11616/m.16893 type:complete len:88 (+) Transcript_11616:149-412(+)|eukprot:8296530-Ditylum_brightwellii.AAC.2